MNDPEIHDEEDSLVKITFRVKSNIEDEYPPVDVETVWARSVRDEECEVDNVPFYIRGLALKDIVRAEARDGELWFVDVLKHSGHSTVRVIVYDSSMIPILRSRLGDCGCPTELSNVPNFISVDIPPSVDYTLIKGILDEGENRGQWGYEEGLIF